MRRGIRPTGLAFAALGHLAMLMPTIATLVMEQLVARRLILWGSEVLMFA